MCSVGPEFVVREASRRGGWFDQGLFDPSVRLMPNLIACLHVMFQWSLARLLVLLSIRATDFSMCVVNQTIHPLPPLPEYHSHSTVGSGTSCSNITMSNSPYQEASYMCVNNNRIGVVLFLFPFDEIYF